MTSRNCFFVTCSCFAIYANIKTCHSSLGQSCLLLSHIQSTYSNENYLKKMLCTAFSPEKCQNYFKHATYQKKLVYWAKINTLYPVAPLRYTPDFHWLSVHCWAGDGIDSRAADYVGDSTCRHFRHCLKTSDSVTVAPACRRDMTSLQSSFWNSLEKRCERDNT